MRCWTHEPHPPPLQEPPPPRPRRAAHGTRWRYTTRSGCQALVSHKNLIAHIHAVGTYVDTMWSGNESLSLVAMFAAKRTRVRSCAPCLPALAGRSHGRVYGGRIGRRRVCPTEPCLDALSPS